MKKLLGLLGTIMIAGNAIPSVIAAAPNRKHSIKKRQNNENTSTTPKTKDDQQPQFLTTSDSKVDIIEKKITLDESYSESIQKILKELIKNNQIDPLRMINNEGIITTEISKKEREENIKILEKLDVILELSKFDENKIRILVLSVKNNTNLIKIVINLNNLYVIGLINNENQYFYFKEEDEKQEKDRIKLEEDIKKIDPKNKSTKTKYDKIKKKILKAKLTQQINAKVIEEYNYQGKNFNLGYTGDYPSGGLNIVIKEDNKEDRGKNINISRNNLNIAISNLSNVNNDNKKNQEIKNDLARIIFITSEAIRFGSDLKYFNHYKNKSKMEQVEFKNIPNDVQNVINDSEKSINWKNYLEQLRGGWKKASKYIESIEFGKKEIFKKLDNEIDYFNVANYFLFNKKLVEKYNFKIYLDSYFKDKILNKYSNIPQLWKQINENYKIKNKIEIIGLDKLLLSELKEYYNYINNKEIKKVLEKINQKKEFKTKIKIKKEKLKKKWPKRIRSY